MSKKNSLKLILLVFVTSFIFSIFSLLPENKLVTQVYAQCIAPTPEPFVEIIRVKLNGGVKYPNPGYALGVSANDYHCVATGWQGEFDINESVTEKWHRWTYISGGQWYLYHNTPSHNNHEKPEVDVVCFKSDVINVKVTGGASLSATDPD